MKLKIPKGNKNYQDHELHFELHHGSRMETVMDWTPSHKVDRNRCIAEYEYQPKRQVERDDGEILFRTTDNETIRIAGEQVVKWDESFEKINVREILERMSHDTMNKKPFFNKKNSFFFLSNYLNKENDKHYQDNIPF